MMNTTYGFSFFEVLVSMLLVTCALLIAMKQQWYIHRIVLQLLSINDALIATDDEIFGV